ncbi:MAG: bifunctional nuclease domain-containing protein, partial [Flavobacteriaceae bacterium]
QPQQPAKARISSAENGRRKLPILMSAAEAQSIAIAIEEDLKPPRPLTHDLLKSCLDRFEIKIKEVIIHKLEEGVFYASLVCNKDQQEELIDARTSDAVAIAVRMGAPIYTYPDILDKAGIELNVDAESKDLNSNTRDLAHIETESTREKEERMQESNPSSRRFKSYSEKQLKAALKKAVEDEDYEKAAALRDELEQRNQ